MTARQLPGRDYSAIKAATRALVKGAGGQESAASVTRVGHQTLSRYGDVEQVENFAPIDVIADLESDIGQPIVTRVLADLAGFDLVARASRDDTSLMRMLPRISKETSDVVVKLSEALADGVVTSEERPGLRAEAHEAIAELHKFLAALDKAEAADV